MTQRTVLDLLRDSGALFSGHFLLSSGRHGSEYIEKFHLLRQPGLTSEVCAGIAERFRDASVDVVVGPTTGGILLAFEVARQLGCAAAYAERGENGQSREFRRATTFAPGGRVLVVDDILTRGGSVQDTLEALQPLDVEVIGVSVLVDRGGGTMDFGVPYAPLATVSFDTWEPSDCPLCARGVPLTKPGTSIQPVSA